MAGSHDPEPGRPRKELSGEIVELLETTDHRAMTLGMITSEVDGARRTVKDRLDSLVEDGPVRTDKIGNATAYWIPGPEPDPAPSFGGGGGPARETEAPDLDTSGVSWTRVFDVASVLLPIQAAVLAVFALFGGGMFFIGYPLFGFFMVAASIIGLGMLLLTYLALRTPGGSTSGAELKLSFTRKG